MAKIINLDEERARRGRPRYTCMECERTVSHHDLVPVFDEAEVYLVCKECKPAFEGRELKRCEFCGRKVYTLYPDPSSMYSMCAICLQQKAEESEMALDGELDIDDDALPDECAFDPSEIGEDDFPDF